MKIVSVNSHKYECYETWADMPLSKAVEITKLLKIAPPQLLSMYEAICIIKDDLHTQKVFSEIKVEEQFKDFPLFYGMIIEQVTNIPREVVDSVLTEERTIFYEQHCLHFVLGLLYSPNIERKNIDSFDWKGTTYYLPTIKKILNEERPMASTTAIEFCEAADLDVYSKNLVGGKFEVAANITAILCRPNGEKYNEELALSRAEGFKELPMDIIWEVFFCLTELSIISKQLEVISFLTKEATQEAEQQVNTQDLADSVGTQVSYRSPIVSRISKWLKKVTYGTS